MLLYKYVMIEVFDGVQYDVAIEEGVELFNQERERIVAVFPAALPDHPSQRETYRVLQKALDKNGERLFTDQQAKFLARLEAQAWRDLASRIHDSECNVDSCRQPPYPAR